MKPILLYSHAEEPVTRLMLSDGLDMEFNLVKLSLEELLKDATIFDELNENGAKVEWTLSSGKKISNSEDFYLFNRVLTVPEELFEEFAEEDRLYSLTEFRAYLAFALEAFPKCSSKPGAFGLSGNRFSLPRQWEMIKNSSISLNVPEYYLGNLTLIPEKQSLVFSSPHDYYYWKPGKAHKDCASFAFDKPKGSPHICCVIGNEAEVFPYQAEKKTSKNHLLILKKISHKLANIFNYGIAEILLFIDNEKISFGMISNIPYASKNKPWFSSLIKSYLRNETSR